MRFRQQVKGRRGRGGQVAERPVGVPGALGRDLVNFAGRAGPAPRSPASGQGRAAAPPRSLARPRPGKRRSARLRRARTRPRPRPPRARPHDAARPCRRHGQAREARQPGRRPARRPAPRGAAPAPAAARPPAARGPASARPPRRQAPPKSHHHPERIQPTLPGPCLPPGGPTRRRRDPHHPGRDPRCHQGRTGRDPRRPRDPEFRAQNPRREIPDISPISCTARSPARAAAPAHAAAARAAATRPAVRSRPRRNHSRLSRSLTAPAVTAGSTPPE